MTFYQKKKKHFRWTAPTNNTPSLCTSTIMLRPTFELVVADSNNWLPADIACFELPVHVLMPNSSRSGHLDLLKFTCA